MDLLTIGTTNPSGLRSKEVLALEQGVGIWNYCETQLSAATQPVCARVLKHLARQQHRSLKVHCSAPAPLRPRSTWAGAWTGCLVTSDYSSKQLNSEWPEALWQSGRIMATQHFIAHQTVTLISVYGFPRGPTWPRAAELTNNILDFITVNYVIGHSGLIVIAGDFNFGPCELPAFAQWRSFGWHSAHDLGEMLWQRPKQATCKGTTERDLLWLSPAAAALRRNVEVQEVFADHSSVSIQLEIKSMPLMSLTWPRPRAIPWDDVNTPVWQAECGNPPELPQNSQDAMVAFAASFEGSLDGHVNSLPHLSLTSAHKGRSRRTTPKSIKSSPSSCRASRPGEVALISDTIGAAVLDWFRQLRRLQSYCHAIKAGQQHLSAVTYRIELWSSIRRARGFNEPFADWWDKQEFLTATGPLSLAPPDAHQASLYFQAFQHVFHQFERWHLSQKQQAVHLKYTKNYQAIFSDLRAPRPDQVDFLWDSNEYKVLAIRPESKSLLLDHAIPIDSKGHWRHQGKLITCQTSCEELLVFDPWPDISVGDSLIFHVHTSTAEEVQSQLLDFWRPRWTASAPYPAELLQRTLAFVGAFLPNLSLELPPITAEQWMSSAKRFKPYAATGADGWSKSDLQHMPLPYVQQLLAFIDDIENGVREWPPQLLEGQVIAIAKKHEAHRPNDFRPIVLLSTIYRCWATLRARQLLRALEPHIHSDALGFLPTREASQAWMLIQSAVEIAQQGHQPLCGVGTDFQKAFNCIRREPLFAAVTQVGFPWRIITPWKSFVNSFTRRFQVMNKVSEAITSDIGFAEGCPLSVVAMVVVDWGLHENQAHFAPGIRCLSFVDNVSFLGAEAQCVALTFFTLRAFLTMWGLTLHLDKTYSWGTTLQSRQHLAQLRLKMVSDVGELGGSLTFTANPKVRLFLKRGQSLMDRWQRLKRSRAPLAQKLMVLPMAFWACALHGALGTIFADLHIGKLRTQAMKALGLQLAGSNPLLRLSLAHPTTVDPGYYQLRTIAFDFRRLCGKSPDILHYWRAYMARYDGKLHPRPFSKLLTVFSSIGWSVDQPPWICDHDGFSHDLLAMPNQLLETLLEDAWFQMVAVQVKHKTMADLSGLDLALTRLDHGQQLPKDLARVRALQSGAFVSTWQHAKYDKTKQPVCQLCMVPDTQKHWLRCPRFAPQRTTCGLTPRHFLDAPDCVVLHLLAPRAPLTLRLKQYFVSLEDLSKSFMSSKVMNGVNHIFTDGSCFPGVTPSVTTAAWAAVNASSGEVLGSGHLPGLQQTIARAELMAFTAATSWTLRYEAHSVIWADSATTVQRAVFLQQHPGYVITTAWENHDLVQKFQVELQQAPDSVVEFRWTPSHLDLELCETDVEDFLAVWNDVADALAVSMNEHRGSAFAQLKHEAERHHADWRERLCKLRAFYLLVADSRDNSDLCIDLTTEVDDWSLQVMNTPLSEALPVNWKQQLNDAEPSQHFPNEFVFDIFARCFDLELSGGHFEAISYIELTLWLVHKLDAQFPIKCAETNSWNLKSVSSMYLRPTLAALIQPVRRAFKHALQLLELDMYMPGHFPKQASGFSIPVDGVILFVSDEMAACVAQLSRDFFSSRTLRKAADLARPAWDLNHWRPRHCSRCVCRQQSSPRYLFEQIVSGGSPCNLCFWIPGVRGLSASPRKMRRQTIRSVAKTGDQTIRDGSKWWPSGKQTWILRITKWFDMICMISLQLIFGRVYFLSISDAARAVPSLHSEREWKNSQKIIFKKSTKKINCFHFAIHSSYEIPKSHIFSAQSQWSLKDLARDKLSDKPPKG